MNLCGLDHPFGTAYGDDATSGAACPRSEGIAARGRGFWISRNPFVTRGFFGDSSVIISLRFWISDPTQGLTISEEASILALWDAFRRTYISIPFPQREVRMPGTADRDPRGVQACSIDVGSPAWCTWAMRPFIENFAFVRCYVRDCCPAPGPLSACHKEDQCPVTQL